MMPKRKTQWSTNVANQMLAFILMEGALSGFKLLLCNLESDRALGAAMHPAIVEDASQMSAKHANQLLHKSIVKSKSTSK